MLAGSLITLTLAIAFWTLLVERRRWLRWLAIGAFCTVIAQAVLGGLTVLFFQPPAVSTAHAAVAQTFFCIAVAIALFTGRRWVEEQPRVEFDQRRPSLFTLTLLSIFVLYVQLILGGMFRHHGMSWWPHVLNAVVVSFVLAWTAVRALTVYSQIEAVRRPAILMLSLLIAQLCLGFTAFLTRVAWGRDRGAARTSYGDRHRGSCRGRSTSARDHRDPGDPGVEACSSSVRRETAAGAARSLGGITAPVGKVLGCALIEAPSSRLHSCTEDRKFTACPNIPPDVVNWLQIPESTFGLESCCSRRSRSGS